MEGKILRDFSKENSSEERGALAKEIKSKRKERHSSLENLGKENSDLEESVGGGQAKIDQLNTEIESLSRSNYSKLLNFLKLIKLKSELLDREKTVAGKTERKNEVDKETQELSIDSGRLPKEFKESKQLIEDFYKRQGEKWEKLPFKKEDIEKYFNPEYLESLSLEDYIVLLKRFGGDMVTHVTRQGVRDHSGMMEHSQGIGEMTNGFKDCLKDGVLKHSLALRISQDQKDESIAKYFDFERCSSKAEALNRLNKFVRENEQYFAGSFVDFHGVHFAVKRVSDDFYGAEAGNELFFVYPSYMMAANYFHRRDPHVPMDASNYNDLWVYLKDDEEIKINSGIAFIPKDAQVDPLTGSKYEVGADGKATPDQQLMARIKELISAPNFNLFAKKANKLLGGMRDYSYEDYKGGFKYGHDEDRKIYDSLIEELRTIHPDITDSEVEVVMDYGLLDDATIFPENEENLKESIERRLGRNGSFYKKAKTTISSEEYWKNYFQKFPNLRPSKIVYYKGGNPTWALRKWKTHNGLQDLEKEDPSFKHKELFVKYDDEVPKDIKDEMERFRSMVEEVIDKRFDDIEEAA